MAQSLLTVRASWPAVALLAGLLCPVTTAVAAADGTCVGEGEYKAIKSGMSIEKLTDVLHGQKPFAESIGKGKQRFRWYVACDEWQPDEDVAVRYHQPIVGRRTVTKKSLSVYVPQ